MPWFAATILCNITSIGEVELSSDGAKGLLFGILGDLEFAAVELPSL
jgi:hypothetical protein